MTSKPVRRHDLYVYELSDEVLNSLQLIKFDLNLNEVSKVPVVNPGKGKGKERESKDFAADKPPKAVETNSSDTSHSVQAPPHTSAPKDLRPVTQTDSVSLQESESSSDDDESIESSDSDDSFESDFGDLKLSDDSSVAVSYLNTHSPYLLLESSLLPPERSQVFGIHKALFLEDELTDPAKALLSWNSYNDKKDNEGKISALFMMGGGHFAGAIVSHTRLNVVGNVRKENQTLQEQAVRLIEHKTFHRYTTRRKQGGSQSAMDNAKGKANSAGSSLRRYNEAALKNDVTELLKLWKPYLDRCSLIFIRARNAHDKSVFFADNILQKTDPRLKTFPFTTGRPTTGELRRSWCELTYMKTVDRPTPIQAKPPAVSTTEGANKTRETEITPVKLNTLTPEEQHTEEIVRLLKKGRAPFLLAYLKKNQLQADFKLMPESKYATTPTMLHYASQQGLKQMVLILLTKLKCSPTVKNVMGKTPWDLSKSDAIRQSFQVARYTLGEDYVNWEEAHIGRPMSKEEVESLNAAGGERQAQEVTTAIMQELEAAREKRKEEKEQKTKSSSGNNGSSRLGTGGSQPPTLVSITQNLNSLTDEQRRRLMREQRARAAEARMRKQAQS